MVNGDRLFPGTEKKQTNIRINLLGKQITKGRILIYKFSSFIVRFQRKLTGKIRKKV